MRKHLFLAFVSAALMAVSTPAQFNLSTGFTGTTSFDGNFFDVVSITGINVQTMDIHLATGTHTVEVWVVTGGGTHNGKEATAALWTRIAQVVGLTSAGNNLPTPLGVPLNVVIPPGTSQGFYVTVSTGGDVRYQTGTAIGTVAASDANMQILEGTYGTYPFSPFTPQARRWNGTVYYNLLANNADDLFVQGLSAPLSVPASAGCVTLTSTETVTLQMFNFGSNTIPAGTVIPVSYTVTPNAGSPTTVNENYVTAAPLAQFAATSYSFATPVDLSLPNTYTFSASASLAGDMDNANDTVMNHVVTSGGNVLINTFPWNENFDGAASNGSLVAPAGWYQDTADATGTNSDWFFRNTTTPTTTTGPTSDHTTGTAGVGYYAQVEDAGNFAMVNLLTPCIDITPLANPTLSFWVHSRNGNTGAGFPNLLAIDVLDDANNIFSNVIPAIGALGTDWNQIFVTLTPFQTVGSGHIRIRFRGMSSGGSTAHDICLDDVQVSEGPLAGTGEDATLRTFINGMGFGLEGNYSVVGGDFMTFNVASDGGTFWGFSPILAGQLFNDGFPPVGAFPGLHINLSAFIIFNGSVPTPIGLTVLGPGGINLSFLTPPGLAPFSMRVQGVVPAGMTLNGIFASTDCHVIDFQ